MLAVYPTLVIMRKIVPDLNIYIYDKPIITCTHNLNLLVMGVLKMLIRSVPCRIDGSHGTRLLGEGVQLKKA